jgi:K(+)-stimulated pyrophosphate-energized sodium pump
MPVAPAAPVAAVAVAATAASVKVKNGVVKFYFATGKSDVAAGGWRSGRQS